MAIEYKTGKDYPLLCRQCQAMVDQCAEEIEVHMSLGDEDMVSGRVRLEFDDDEAPCTLAYDRGLFCGGHECECTCSAGFPDYDKSDDILCNVHGGTEAEKQEFLESLCEKTGHYFPSWTARLNRTGVCLICLGAYGQAEPILAEGRG